MTECRSEIAANVWKVTVEVGQQVEAGHELVILESMKMEIPVEAPTAGVVSEIRVAEGSQVAEGDVLVVLEPGG
jgi:biotin carboxyl carrier protein